MATAVDLFGGNSDGTVRMEEWLRAMCQGCVKDRGRSKTDLGGMSCELPTRAYIGPYDADMPEWSEDATPKPERFAELGAGPWPVCMAYQPRKRRSDAGTSRAPAGMDALFELEAS
jgi:hypothetical protein